MTPILQKLKVGTRFKIKNDHQYAQMLLKVATNDGAGITFRCESGRPPTYAMSRVTLTWLDEHEAIEIVEKKIHKIK